MKTAANWLVGLWLTLVSVALYPGLVAALAYAGLNALNASREGAPRTPWGRLLDRVAIACRRGAVNRYSLPVLGKSIFEEIRQHAAEIEAEETAKLRALSAAEAQAADRPSRPGFAVVDTLAAIAWVVVLGLGAVAAFAGCSPTLPVDLYRGAGTGVAVTAAAGREVALLEARDCLSKPSRGEAELCLQSWRARWAPIAQAWQGAAARAQSLAHVERTVLAQLEARYPSSARADGAAADASEGGAQ